MSLRALIAIMLESYKRKLFEALGTHEWFTREGN
jgi:hypothetical protein